MGDTPSPYYVNWDDWEDDWVVSSADNTHVVRIPRSSNNDQQGYAIQRAINEIIDRISVEWL